MQNNKETHEWQHIDQDLDSQHSSIGKIHWKIKKTIGKRAKIFKQTYFWPSIAPPKFMWIMCRESFKLVTTKMNIITNIEMIDAPQPIVEISPKGESSI